MTHETQLTVTPVVTSDELLPDKSLPTSTQVTKLLLTDDNSTVIFVPSTVESLYDEKSLVAKTSVSPVVVDSL